MNALSKYGYDSADMIIYYISYALLHKNLLKLKIKYTQNKVYTLFQM